MTVDKGERQNFLLVGDCEFLVTVFTISGDADVALIRFCENNYSESLLYVMKVNVDESAFDNVIVTSTRFSKSSVFRARCSILEGEYLLVEVKCVSIVVFYCHILTRRYVRWRLYIIFR